MEKNSSSVVSFYAHLSLKGAGRGKGGGALFSKRIGKGEEEKGNPERARCQSFNSCSSRNFDRGKKKERGGMNLPLEKQQKAGKITNARRFKLSLVWGVPSQGPKRKEKSYVAR